MSFGGLLSEKFIQKVINPPGKFDEIFANRVSGKESIFEIFRIMNFPRVALGKIAKIYILVEGTHSISYSMGRAPPSLRSGNRVRTPISDPGSRFGVRGSDLGSRTPIYRKLGVRAHFPIYVRNPGDMAPELPVIYHPILVGEKWPKFR